MSDPIPPGTIAQFDQRMVDIYRTAKSELGYNATYFLRMISERGGLATARSLISSATVSEGFTALWERKRLDLTVEALVLQEEFAGLFTEDELDMARDRLAQYGYRG
jgi:hypothetical protein